MKGESVLTAREFQQHSARITKQLQPGESVIVTNRGEKIGSFNKSVNPPRKLPDFYANLEGLGRSTTVGQKLIDRIVHGLP